MIGSDVRWKGKFLGGWYAQGIMIHRMETKQLDRFPLPIWSPWRIKLDTIIQIEMFINALAVLGLPHSLTDSLTHSLTALDSKLSAFQSKPKHLPDLTNRHDLPTWSTYLPDLLGWSGLWRGTFLRQFLGVHLQAYIWFLMLLHCEWQLIFFLPGIQLRSSKATMVHPCHTVKV